MTKTALYARVSTDDKGQDTGLQLDEMRRYCAAKEYEVFREYVEEVSGTGKASRPQFEALMEAARRREFDVVVVWKLDRFTREGAFKALGYIKRLDEYGVRFVSLTEGFLDTTSSFRDVLLALMGWLAEQESKKISDRVRSGIARKRAEKGDAFRIGRAAAQIDEQKILALHAEGLSLRQIAAQVTRKAKNGRLVPISHGLVRKVLLKRSTCGS